MKFYEFRQNNSGGSFSGPAIAVYIEANNSDEADRIAQTKGIYFDDDYEIDCDCCGTRWHRSYENSAVLFSEIPEPSDHMLGFAKSDNVETTKVILYNH